MAKSGIKYTVKFKVNYVNIDNNVIEQVTNSLSDSYWYMVYHSIGHKHIISSWRQIGSRAFMNNVIPVLDAVKEKMYNEHDEH